MTRDPLIYGLVAIAFGLLAVAFALIGYILATR